MSGIFGIFHTDGKPVDEKHLDMMANGLSFLRPSEVDIQVDGPVGMGGCTSDCFAFRSGTFAAKQKPIKSIMVSADVRLHNRTELRREFDRAGTTERDCSDIDLIHLSYEQWGARCPYHLEGEFTFAVWDPVYRQLFCARDHMGHKPFFYAWLKNTFIFSSHVRAIRAFEHFPIELNEHSFAAALFLIEGDKSQTYFKGIRRLKAAHSLTLTQGAHHSMLLKPFWHLQPKTRQTKMTDEDYADAFREIIKNAVHKCLDPTRPTGATLSGGLDSSAVACIAARELMKTGQNLFSVSSVLAEDHKGVERDERKYIQEVALQETNIVNSFVVAEGAHPFEGLESKFDRLNTPLNPFHYMDDAIAKSFSELGTKTVLSGFQGDALVSYDGRDSISRLIRQMRWVTALHCIQAQRRVQDETIGAIYRKNIVPWLLPKLPYYLQRWKLGTKEARPFSPASEAFSSRFQHKYPRMRNLFPIWLKSLLEYGSPTMESQSVNYAALGMNIRFPYWDKDVIEFLVSLPPEQFISGGIKRSLFRRAMKGILPETIRLRNTKHPYTPDFHRRVWSRKNEILQYLNGIESDPCLREMVSFYIDTNKIRKKLETIRPARSWNDWDPETQGVVVSGIISIRFLIWMSRL